MMRILIVTQYFWPENFRINDLAVALQERGHQVTVLTGKPNYPSGVVFPEFQSNPNSYVEYLGIKVIRVPILPRATGYFRLALNYLTFLFSASLMGPWRLRTKIFDVVFVFGASPITVLIPALVMGRLRKIPVVPWVLDLWPESIAAVGVTRSPWILWAIKQLVILLYNQSAVILGQSRSIVTSISRRTRNPERVRYLPSWAEDVFQERPTGKGDAIPDCRQRFTIMFAGNIGEAQDVPSILKAIEILRDKDQLRWVFVGDGRRAQWLREQIAVRHLSERVLMVARRSIDQMPSLYAQADAMLVSLKQTLR
jgi:glycosyltransferase involved in cell wall biosynthesis